MYDAFYIVKILQKGLKFYDSLYIRLFCFTHPVRIIAVNIVKTTRLSKGQYVAAISGGVDSMVLLDILSQLPGVHVTVAHFDHGIRTDSRLDRLHVAQAAKQYKLPFVYGEGNLGENVSEAAARKARYAFLRTIQKQTGAQGIVTAHHMDDVLETATHNILRGTGRRGMSSLKSVDGIIRPLLHLPKQQLIDYATANNLKWREDSTNTDIRYRRNYIRHRILPRIRELSPEKFELLKRITRRQADLNHAIDRELSTILHTQPDTKTLRRYDVTSLPHAVARELVGEWLRNNGKNEFNRKTLEKTTTALKVARPKTTLILDKNYKIEFDKKHAHLVSS
jgi:tRNA(Ile)-lysidine synthase